MLYFLGAYSKIHRTLSIFLMSKRDFFRIIIKLLCFYLMTILVFDFIKVISHAVIIELDSGWLFILVSIVPSAVALGVLMIVVTKYVDRALDWLRMDKGFDSDHIEVGALTISQIATFAVMLIGGYVIVIHLPGFLHHCISIFQLESSTGVFRDIENMLQPRDPYSAWWLSLIHLFIGYLLLTNASKIGRWLVRAERGESS